MTFLGARDYSMRVWLDPEKLASRDMTAGDVVKALQEQNVQVAAGRIGAAAGPGGQEFQLTINTQGRLPRAGRVRGRHRQDRATDGQITRVTRRRPGRDSAPRTTT